MVDDLAVGRRPTVQAGVDTSLALSCCPGIGLEHDVGSLDRDPLGLFDAWGPVLEVWEGHATDPELRFNGSSGGVATALGVHAVHEGLGGVLHIRARDDEPLLNETTVSRTVDAVLDACGSRYAPASPCDGLQQAIDSESAFAFIGKPCDIAAVKKATRAGFVQLDQQIAVTIAIFCAGAPSTEGTLRMIDAMGIPNDAVIDGVHYRGRGWPGNAAVHVRGEQRPHELSYAKSWGMLQRYRPWRCRVCADHTGEFADIAVGDPWYRPIEEDEIGSSLIVARTERGRHFIRSAAEAGIIELRAAPADIIERSQPNLLETRGAVWGRILASRLVGLPAPRYRNIPMFRQWWSVLSFRKKVSSVAGTLSRILRKRLHRRQPVRAYQGDELARRTRAASG